MATKIQLRRDSSTNWTTNNPTLSSGELGYETDTGKFKIGDGVDDWNTLAYNTTDISGKLDLSGGTMTGDLDMDGNTTTLGGVVEDYTDLGTLNGALTVDSSVSTVFAATLDGDVVFGGFTAPAAGQGATLIIKQDATGSRLWSINGITGKYAMGVNTLSTAANAVDVMHVFYDGTDYYFSLSKGYV